MRTQLHILTATLLTSVVTAAAQQLPHLQGSQNSMTVVNTTRPADDTPAAFHPAGMQSPKTGALRVKVSQGTKNAPPIGPDPVTVELFAAGHVIHTYKTQLSNNQFELDNLPLDTPFQPIITVLHTGAPEELIGPPMHKFQPAVELDMPLYETTSEKPAWTSGIRHVTLLPALSGSTLSLHVTDMLGGFNPSDHAWLGDNNTTLTLQLPPNATDIQLGQGLAEANPTISNSTISRHKPMLPGPTEYDCGYSLPVTNGKASASFTLPADTTLFALYLPANIHIDNVTHLSLSTSSGKYGLEGRQLLVGKSLKAGQTITLDLSNITPPPAPPAPATQPTEQHTHLNLPRTSETHP